MIIMKKSLQLIIAVFSIAIAAGQEQAVIFTFGSTPDASCVSPISVAGGSLIEFHFFFTERLIIEDVC